MIPRKLALSGYVWYRNLESFISWPPDYEYITIFPGP